MTTRISKTEDPMNVAGVVFNARKQNIQDLFTLLSVLYERGPKTLEALTEELNSVKGEVSDNRVSALVDYAGNLNEWLGLS